MRHFTLVNSAGAIKNITTEEVLFHDISGLGFNEDNDFRHIGEVWWLNHTSYNQATVSGKIMFTEKGGDPYSKYWEFAKFISKQPLTLLYNPHKPIAATILGDPEDDEFTYYKTVRVSKLDKSEKNEYGVIDETIEFISYTPWYKKETAGSKPKETEEETEEVSGWIWGGPVGSDLLTYALDDEVDGQGNRVPQSIEFPQDYETADPLVFEPEGAILTVPDYSSDDETATTTVTVQAYSGDCSPTIFRVEALSNLYISLESAVKSPVKLIIYGPIIKPSWTHSVVNSDGVPVTVGSGAFTSNISLSSKDEFIVVDNTGGQYQIYKHNANGTNSDIYADRNFSLPCFITLREGENRISVVSSEGGEPAKNVYIEGHMYYATV